MKLIKKLNTKIINGRCFSFGLFFCGHCKQEIEKRLDSGKRDKSCGCNSGKNFIYGEGNTKLYKVWREMLQRCIKIDNHNYKYYGGRGIIVCTEWLNKENGYINFKNWALYNGYQEGLEIDRIDNDGNYEPNNCRWVTRKDNNRNTRKIKLSIDKVNKIIELYKTGLYSQRYLAIKFEVSLSSINLVVNKKHWICNV